MVFWQYQWDQILEQNVSNFSQKLPQNFILKSDVCQNSQKVNTIGIWATFILALSPRPFRKKPNLVTLSHKSANRCSIIQQRWVSISFKLN